MKSVLFTAAAASSLFVGTVGGLLALQGRLNFEGTRGIPVVEMLFRKASEGEEPTEAIAVEGDGPALDGLGREPKVPRAVGPSVKDVELPSGDTPMPRPAPPGGADAEPVEPADEAQPEKWKEAAESLLGSDQYRRGKLFRFPRLDSGMSVEELDRILRQVRTQEEELKRRQATLEQREAEMATRERDIEERRRQVQELMREVLQEREAVREDVAELQAMHTIVGRAEAEQFTTYARTLAALDPAKAADVIRQMWTTEDGKTKATKILKMMARDALQEVLGVMTAEETREILDRVAAAVEEGAEKK